MVLQLKNLLMNVTTDFESSETKFSTLNVSDFEDVSDEYIFDKIYIRIIFVFLYSMVFCLCFFGKSFFFVNFFFAMIYANRRQELDSQTVQFLQMH